MRRSPILLTLALALGVPVADARAEPYQEGKANWLAALYPDAYPPLMIHRAAPRGRTAEVDYMLGTSGCRISGKRDWGARVLNYVLYSYALTTESRARVIAERDKCRAQGQLAALTASERTALERLVPAGATARTKMFYFAEDRGIAAYPAKRKRVVAEADLAARRVPVGRTEELRQALAPLLPTRFEVRAKGRFAFVVERTRPAADIDTIAMHLDRFMVFVGDSFGLTAPENFITVYLVSDLFEVPPLAERVHGLDVSPATLGYTYQDDMSVVAYVRGAQSGTLLHELFHLMVRESFGDIPQWLDEGMAGLYEVSMWDGTGYRGLPNWRGKVLQQGWHRRPQLAEVIASPWFGFDSTDNEREMDPEMRGLPMAVHLAMARYLALYLQEKGKLAEVYRAFQRRDPGAADDPGAAAVALVESVAGPMARLQPEFEAWFQRIGDADESNSHGTVGKSLPPPGPGD